MRSPDQGGARTMAPSIVAEANVANRARAREVRPMTVHAGDPQRTPRH